MNLAEKGYEIRGKVFKPAPKEEKKEENSDQEPKGIQVIHTCTKQDNAKLIFDCDLKEVRKTWNRDEASGEYLSVDVVCPHCGETEHYNLQKKAA